MKVGILQTYFAEKGPGGGEVHTTQLARALEQLGHEVTIYTDVPKSPRTDITDLTVQTFQTPLKINPVAELTLGYKAKSALESCDVALLTDESAWMGVDISIPTVMIFHLVWHGWILRHGSGWPTLRDKPQAYLYRYLERKIAKETDAIIAISDNMAEDIGRIGDFKAKMYSIPNGVDIDRFKPLENQYDKFTVHFQGRLVEMKNPDQLIRACAKSKEDWRLTIGGDGPMREDLESLSSELGITDRVEFLGYVSEDNLPVRYARSHVYALPSEYEGMPLTILEAAASGTAIVASQRAATQFVTSDLGRIIKTTPEDIAETLDRLSTNPGLTQKLGENARAKSESYSWDVIAEQYASLFENIVN